MHTKTKGTIGELAVTKALYEMGYSVFSEIGDNCKVDLIAIKEDKILKIQVKSHTSKNGKIDLVRTSSGPGYSYKYTDADVDYIASYILDKDIVIFVPMSEMMQMSKGMSFRIEPSKNNQACRMVEDFLHI